MSNRHIFSFLMPAARTPEIAWNRVSKICGSVPTIKDAKVIWDPDGFTKVIVELEGNVPHTYWAAKTLAHRMGSIPYLGFV